MFKSKIVLFLLLAITPVLLISCENNKNDVIPDVYVDFWLDLNDPEFFDLLSISGTDTVGYWTNNWGQAAAGYDNNGIIVHKAFADQYYAYDRTCPHDFEVNKKSVKINVDGSYAVCPECGTQYSLPSGGVPLPGSAGKYPLKNYRTAFFGTTIHVWNY